MSASSRVLLTLLLATSAALTGSLAGQTGTGAEPDGVGQLAILLASAPVDGSVGAPDSPTASSGERSGRSGAKARANSFVSSTAPRSASALFASMEASLVHAVPPQQRSSSGGDVAMMAVGGAALVVGLMIGGDRGMLIASTGGFIGLIGLYRYLR